MQEKIIKVLDKNEAPDGYYAVLKDDAYKFGRTSDKANMNYCEFCDWRKQCCDNSITKAIHNHRCMSYEVIIEDTGEIVSRNDKCSVLFKKIVLNN
jgi:hypothetical protein